MKAFDYQPDYKKTTLSNGVRIVTEHHPYTRATSVGFFVDLGSRDESPDLIGSAHFLEHVLFKGTHKRTAYDIVSELESVGGEINAYTAKEYTCYHASTLREHQNISLDVLADLLVNANCAESEIDKERNVILQEIDMSKDIVEEYIFDHYFEKCFAGHPLSQPILGTAKSLATINRKKLFDFYNQRYHGPHLVVSVAGDVHHDKVVEQLKSLENLHKPMGQEVLRTPAQVKGFVDVVERPSEQLHLLVGLPSSHFLSSERFEAYIVNAALGGATTSRLYQKIRETKGLAYNVYSYLQSFTDSALLLTYVGTALENSQECLEIIRKEFDDFMQNGLSQQEVDYYKTQVMGQIMLSADDIESRMNSIAVNEMVFHKYRPVDEILQEVESVNKDTVKDYIDKYFDLAQSGFLAIGNGANQAEKLKNIFTT